MTTLRSESRKALQYVIDKGRPVTAADYAIFNETPPSGVHRTYAVLMRLGIMDRRRIGPALFEYFITDLDRAQALANEIPKKKSLEPRKTPRRKGYVHPMPCSFVFNLGAQCQNMAQ